MWKTLHIVQIVFDWKVLMSKDLGHKQVTKNQCAGAPAVNTANGIPSERKALSFSSAHYCIFISAHSLSPRLITPYSLITLNSRTHSFSSSILPIISISLHPAFSLFLSNQISTQFPKHFSVFFPSLSLFIILYLFTISMISFLATS